jgi:hypothetical protein
VNVSKCTIGAVIAFSAVATSMALAAPAPQHIRGTITSYSGGTLVVATATGPVSLHVSPKARIAGILPANASDIKTGTFIGTANAPMGGTARALEVVVFPDSMRGTGEGDYPWDLSAAGKPSAMTNGTVAAPHGSSMTTYKGGTKRISIPPNVPVVRVEPGSRALLVAGAHVFVAAVPMAGKLTALFVSAGEKGTVPPM